MAAPGDAVPLDVGLKQALAAHKATYSEEQLRCDSYLYSFEFLH